MSSHSDAKLRFTTRMGATHRSAPSLAGLGERRWLREDGLEEPFEKVGLPEPRNTNLKRAKES
jgi:hypothetical protein